VILCQFFQETSFTCVTRYTYFYHDGTSSESQRPFDGSLPAWTHLSHDTFQEINWIPYINVKFVHFFTDSMECTYCSQYSWTSAKHEKHFRRHRLHCCMENREDYSSAQTAWVLLGWSIEWRYRLSWNMIVVRYWTILFQLSGTCKDTHRIVNQLQPSRWATYWSGWSAIYRRLLSEKQRDITQ
jgi:hypothetical protein